MNMALFFTRGVSLQLWFETGLFYREKLIYEEHLKQDNFEKIYWLTYGHKDAELELTLKNNGLLHHDIIVIPMPRYFTIGKVGSWLYSFFMPFIQLDILKKTDILKTNQMSGGWAAVIAKFIYKKPLLLRTGYTLSTFISNKGYSGIVTRFYKIIERISFNYCDVGVVSSQNDKHYICEQHKINPNNIHVLYNYVNSEQFCPANVPQFEDRLIFIGRLSQQKNLSNLIKAIALTEFTLDIYGTGELKMKLEELAKKINAKANFMGVLPNNRMPAVLNKYKYFILPSLYEGMPKALLEAMACGLVCIGTDVKGINEIIEDNKTGYLAYETGYLKLAETIKKVVTSDKNQISLNARKKIVDCYSLKEIVRKEKELFFKLIT